MEISLLTFEPGAPQSWPSAEREAWRQRLDAEGIRWRMLPYHKRPSVPATLFDVWNGARLARKLVQDEQVCVLHARGHVAAAMGALAKRGRSTQLLFDIRGFMPEEYVDAGAWPRDGWLFRLVKRAERRLLDASDGFVVLTERAREILFDTKGDSDRAGRPIAVIPCCVDHERFTAHDSVSREQVRADLGIEGRRVIAYVGALGGWYLTEELVELLAVAHRDDPSTFSLILTQSDPSTIRQLLGKKGIRDADCLIGRVQSGDIPRYLKAADLAVSFIKPCYSKLSSSPTKLAEYLASGLPVICNSGIGDVDRVIERHKVGVLVHSSGEEVYRQALAEAERLRATPGISERCWKCSWQEFSLEEVGGVRYRWLYERILSALCKSEPNPLPSTSC